MVNDWQGPRAALHAMRSSDTDVLFVLGRDNILQGILTEDQAGRLARQKVESLRGLELGEVMTADPDAYIEDLIPMAASTEHPIAVVNEDGRLLGEVHRGALLTGMYDAETDDESAEG